VVRYEWVSFLTDYGLADGFVAACHGVIGRIAPEVRVLDVTHQVPAYAVRRGAMVLAQTVPYLPPAVHLAVVDPGVGTDRHGVVVVARDGVLVGPDNGLLVPAAEALGGVLRAYEVSSSGYRLPLVSTTFHGRDVFAPVAAHLALGVAPEEFGPPVDIQRLPKPWKSVTAGVLEAEVLGVDHFGSVQLAASADDLTAAGLVAGTPVLVAEVPGVVARTFGDVAPGALLVLVDSMGKVGVAVNRGSAAALLGDVERVRILRV
jgi:S-adenosylmethionine hydrolase